MGRMTVGNLVPRSIDIPCGLTRDTLYEQIKDWETQVGRPFKARYYLVKSNNNECIVYGDVKSSEYVSGVLKTPVYIAIIIYISEHTRKIEIEAFNINPVDSDLLGKPVEDLEIRSHMSWDGINIQAFIDELANRLDTLVNRGC